eukprot:Colp12_sorted_trinity150504_noHs@28590
MLFGESAIQPPGVAVTVTLDVQRSTCFKIVFTRFTNDLEHVFRDLNALCLTTRLHFGAEVDRSTKQAEARHLDAHDPSDSLTRMQTDTKLKFLFRHVRDGAAGNGITKFKTSVGDLKCMAFTVSNRYTRHNHVGITDSFNLVNIVIIQDSIENSVKTVQKLDHLHRRTTTGNSGEADNVREVDACGIEFFCLNELALLKIVGNTFGKKFVQQLLSLLLFDLELLRALVHHVLKTRRVLLKHTDDAVDQVARLGIKGCDLSNDRFKARANGGIFVPAFLHQLPVTMGAIVRYFRAEVALLDLCDDVNRLQVVCHVRTFTRQQLPHNDT